MSKDTLSCEFCGQEVNQEDFLYLSENYSYANDNVYIVHVDCGDPDGHRIVHVYEIRGNLRLVRVSPS